ncbi:DUF2218 domain-containing protein [Roseibium litorale]|uniref:DUF2218 domain-containing protein n=1 Tax=Roseibium litorale TaxID=2803841 RepID=A0ABR9CUD8_9HYPH|nr:DUF2218 domain-containing protein [Roseibium litorale]MBD8893891.1 DUF2218 domain-containing protein [Roseibium litorale]
MYIVETTVQTASATKYLQQLCKHFTHKVPAAWTQEAGSVTFPYGDCIMHARDNALHIQCQTHDAENVALLKDVIGSHLRQFAWRETLQLVWQETRASCPLST